MNRIAIATKTIASFAILTAVTDMMYWLAKHRLDSVSWYFLLYPLSSSVVEGLRIVDSSGFFCKLGNTCRGLHVYSVRTMETQIMVKGLLVSLSLSLLVKTRVLWWEVFIFITSFDLGFET